MSFIKFISRNNRGLYYRFNQIQFYSDNASASETTDNFKPLNLRNVKAQPFIKRRFKKAEVLPPRTNQMPVDQDWGNVWPGPRTFHPASVPLPLHQGWVEKGAPPGKFANAELMKIPNFLHLTPPVVKRQCEALKKFCTPWPEGVETDEKCTEHFPLEIITSDYCHSSPTIRDPLARIVTLKVKFSKLDLDQHARDKFLRLVGERYDEETDIVTIVTDRCPTRKQNLDYAMYLLTALYHESWTVEPWESTKSEADMEYYDWDKSVSKTSIEDIYNWDKIEENKVDASKIPNITEYSNAATALWNEAMPIDNDVRYAVMYNPQETCNFLNKAIERASSRYDPTAIYAPPSLDSIQVLATMAFVAFLLQSLMAIIDRTRQLPTVVQARKNYTKKPEKVWEAIQKYHTKNWEQKS